MFCKQSRQWLLATGLLVLLPDILEAHWQWIASIFAGTEKTQGILASYFFRTTLKTTLSPCAGMVWCWQRMLAVNLLSCSPWLPCAQTSHWRKTRLHLVSRGSRVHRALSLPPVAAVLSAWVLLAPFIRQGSLAGHDPACNGLSCYCCPASGHPFFTHCRGCSAGIPSILISCPVLSRNYWTGLPSFSVDFMVPCLCPWTASSPPAPVLHVVSLVLMGFPWFLFATFSWTDLHKFPDCPPCFPTAGRLEHISCHHRCCSKQDS